MNQAERRRFLIKAFLDELSNGDSVRIPEKLAEQRRLLRGLMNVRPAGLPSAEILRVQDEYLRERNAERGIAHLDSLMQIRPHIFLWQGDITALACDAIVNAANSQMTGCWAPNHLCIDNCIHTFAGVQLRYECDRLMEAQGCPEPTGSAKITKSYNLPCKYVIHTVGPIADGRPTATHCDQLAACYRSCYSLAKKQGLQSIAFCCISTGVFGFPQKQAAEIAIATVSDLIEADSCPLNVVFNVFLDEDARIYSKLLASG